MSERRAAVHRLAARPPHISFGCEEEHSVTVNLSSRESGEVTIVDIAGSVTLGQGSNSLRDKLSELIARSRKKLLLNMTEVSYIDSSGIRELLSAYNALSKIGGQIKLLNPTQRVKDLLKITRLHTVFEVFDDETTAVGSFN
jgi:anti-sigma B factor antagonist